MPLAMTHEADFAEFTEAGYRRLVRAARERYEFVAFGAPAPEHHVLWRHDLDYSVHRALALAEIEADEGVHATYNFLLHSELYNLLEPAVLQRARRILELGHWPGLHFDVGFYGTLADEDALAEKATSERDLLEALFEREVTAFSLHNTQVSDSAGFDADAIAGLPSANGRTLRATHGYVSDSNGYWRWDSLGDVLGSGEHERLHVLTHPEWWTPEPMSPRTRILRCIEGRARSAEESYDTLLAIYGRDEHPLAAQQARRVRRAAPHQRVDRGQPGHEASASPCGYGRGAKSCSTSSRPAAAKRCPPGSRRRPRRRGRRLRRPPATSDTRRSVAWPSDGRADERTKRPASRPRCAAMRAQRTLVVVGERVARRRDQRLERRPWSRRSAARGVGRPHRREDPLAPRARGVGAHLAHLAQPGVGAHDRHRDPRGGAADEELDAVHVRPARLGELHVVEQDEDVGAGQLVPPPQPRQEVRLVDGDERTVSHARSVSWPSARPRWAGPR